MVVGDSVRASGRKPKTWRSLSHSASFCHVPCGLQREQTQVLSLTGVFNFSGGWYPYMAFASHLLRLDSALQSSPSRENGNVTLSVAAN